jgi:hypothetical protein
MLLLFDLNLVVLYSHIAETICLQLILCIPHYEPQTPLHPPNSIPVEQTRANDGVGTNKTIVLGHTNPVIAKKTVRSNMAFLVLISVVVVTM